MQESLFFPDSYAISFDELFAGNYNRARGILDSKFDKAYRTTPKRFLKQQHIMSMLQAMRTGKTIPMVNLNTYLFNPHTSYHIRRYCRQNAVVLP